MGSPNATPYPPMPSGQGTKKRHTVRVNAAAPTIQTHQLQIGAQRGQTCMWACWHGHGQTLCIRGIRHIVKASPQAGSTLHERMPAVYTAANTKAQTKKRAAWINQWWGMSHIRSCLRKIHGSAVTAVCSIHGQHVKQKRVDTCACSSCRSCACACTRACRIHSRACQMLSTNQANKGGAGVHSSSSSSSRSGSQQREKEREKAATKERYSTSHKRQ